MDDDTLHAGQSAAGAMTDREIEHLRQFLGAYTAASRSNRRGSSTDNVRYLNPRREPGDAE